MSEQADNAKSAITDDVAEQLAIIMAISKEMGIKYPDVVSQADAMMAAGVKHHDDMRQVLAATLVGPLTLPAFAITVEGNGQEIEDGDSWRQSPMRSRRPRWSWTHERPRIRHAPEGQA